MVLNLFIFFFVSFSLLYTFSPERLSRLEVKLPKSSTAQGGAATVTVVTVTRDGKCHLGDRPLSESQLTPELAKLAQSNPKVSVLIRADEAAPCRALVSVFDACRTAGIYQTSFAVQSAGAE